MFGLKKKKTDEELLADTEKRREESERQLDSLKSRLDIEIEIARNRIESDSIREKLKNPYALAKDVKNEDKRRK